MPFGRRPYARLTDYMIIQEGLGDAELSEVAAKLRSAKQARARGARAKCSINHPSPPCSITTLIERRPVRSPLRPV